MNFNDFPQSFAPRYEIWKFIPLGLLKKCRRWKSSFGNISPVEIIWEMPKLKIPPCTNVREIFHGYPLMNKLLNTSLMLITGATIWEPNLRLGIGPEFYCNLPYRVRGGSHRRPAVLKSDSLLLLLLSSLAVFPRSIIKPSAKPQSPT